MHSLIGHGLRGGQNSGQLLLLFRAALVAKWGSRTYRLPAGPPALACQQRVEERIHTRVPISQPCEDAINGHLRAHRHHAQNLRPVQW